MFLPRHRVSKTSRSFEKCLMMSRTNTLGSERSWRRLFVKKNHKKENTHKTNKHKQKTKWFGKGFLKAYTQANRGRLGDINPCTLLHSLSEAPCEMLWALPLLFVLVLDASTSVLEDESLYPISNLSFFMISSYSFVLMPILSLGLYGFFSSAMFYSLLLFVIIKRNHKLVF